MSSIHEDWSSFKTQLELQRLKRNYRKKKTFINEAGKTYPFSLKKACPFPRPLELDLALEILEEDEILKQNVSSEVAVTQLKVHQLQKGGKFALYYQVNDWSVLITARTEFSFYWIVEWKTGRTNFLTGEELGKVDMVSSSSPHLLQLSLRCLHIIQFIALKHS